jgi:hypothetical protein
MRKEQSGRQAGKVMRHPSPRSAGANCAIDKAVKVQNRFVHLHASPRLIQTRVNHDFRVLDGALLLPLASTWTTTTTTIISINLVAW